jgi:hypothetical protein
MTTAQLAASSKALPLHLSSTHQRHPFVSTQFGDLSLDPEIFLREGITNEPLPESAVKGPHPTPQSLLDLV